MLSPALSVKIGSIYSEDLSALVEGVDLLVLAMDPRDERVRRALSSSLGKMKQTVVLNLTPYEIESFSNSKDIRYIGRQTLQLCLIAECYRLWNKKYPSRELLQKALSDVAISLL
jgi:hypothetical protein